MKSATSYFNKTLFKKDLTRFAPAWGGLLIFLLLAMISISGEEEAYYRLMNLRDCLTAYAWINLIYAAVAAQLLFGDLYNSRMCNALHAMPLRRESQFVTHMASGMVFSLVPNVLAALMAFPVLRLGAGWSAVFWWLLGSQLQYLFFFGTAVLCTMLAGNRLGQAALYAALSFGALLAGWMVINVYQPFLHGVQYSDTPFLLACPLAQISSETRDVLVIEYERIEDAFGVLQHYRVDGVRAGDGWGYMGICAAVGVLALAAALVLYRKRKLECAGDFLAFPVMEPVVTVGASIFVGGVFHLFADTFGMNLRSVMLGAGMVVGFFACRMLLTRSTRVFSKKAFLFCGSIVAVFGLTVLLTWLDPAGISRYLPEADQVESITFSQSYSLHSHAGFAYTATDPEEIAQLQQVHRLGIEKQSNVQPGGTEEEYYPFSLRLEYKLKNGRTFNRFYEVHPRAEAGVILKDYFNRMEFVLGVTEEQLPRMVPYLRSLYTEGREQTQYDMQGLDIEGLFAAITADCRAGNMAQVSGYHHPSNYDLLEGEAVYDLPVTFLELGWDRELLAQNGETLDRELPAMRYTSLRIFASCENTLRWMRENGLLTADSQLEQIAKYDGYFAWTE